MKNPGQGTRMDLPQSTGSSPSRNRSGICSSAGKWPFSKSDGSGLLALVTPVLNQADGKRRQWSLGIHGIRVCSLLLTPRLTTRATRMPLLKEIYSGSLIRRRSVLSPALISLIWQYSYRWSLRSQRPPHASMGSTQSGPHHS